MRYLDLEDVRAVALVVLGGRLEVRDWGLLQSAIARPSTTVFGDDAYPTVWDKAAALMHSLVGNHALVDGNKRVGFACAVLLLFGNDVRLAYEEDDAYDLVIAVAEGRLEVPGIAAGLRQWQNAG